MALIKCPECHQEVSDKAKTCPHCGNPMKKVSLPDLSNLKKKPSKNFIIVGLVIAAVIVAVFGFTLLSNRDPYDRLAKRVEEIQKDPALADADQIQSDIELMTQVIHQWSEESSGIVNDIIMVWEDADRINANAEPANKSFTDEYINGATNENEAISKFKNSEKFKRYKEKSDKIDSNLTIINQYKNDSVSQGNYIPEDLINLSDSASWYYVETGHLYNLATKDLGSTTPYSSYTPKFSKTDGTRDLYPDFLAKNKNRINLADYCAMVDFTEGNINYSYDKVNERMDIVDKQKQ
ncbi:zinc ribbon domain-containing protein [uncultured Dubosiella sp.]|uniref:zinc-ribbon domain-containing protein n=1 Tax=uncultured Dubosiella sp. TaxID=1937011 RepID=UPI00207F9E7D|nr:zinc ribbon domain-containing protein [uncultured Dubosiella sp.]GJM58297.1 hypothetical protein EROP_19900 [Erysipelotrichaceae bacterium OPF54]